MNEAADPQLQPVHSLLKRRRAGVLLHITSLPGPATVGDLGSNAYRFVDFLVASGMTVWQILPIGPTMHDNSPYQSSSVYAGNPRLISLEMLLERGWLDEMPEAPISDEVKSNSIHNASKRFQESASDEERHEYQRFIAEQKHWLEDYALFQALKQEENACWWDWHVTLRDRKPQALAMARARLKSVIQTICFEQYLFYTQWMCLKQYANERGVLLFGDVPIFVAHDSAEVWAHREIFDLLEDGHPRVVAGVPPDYFSETGQRWGNPLYCWDKLSEDNFSFWVNRLKAQSTLFDLLRIDHFRGFEAYWEIPAEEETAVNGHWVEAPGEELFGVLYRELPDLELVAEDLGVITPEVEALRKACDLPGMKILQFAFSGGADNPYLPFHHTKDAVVYTGTHDNDTTLGWYTGLDDQSREFVDEYLGKPREIMPWPMIRSALASRANLAIIPLQDILGLDGSHRMNTPGTTEGNWDWRFDWEMVKPETESRLMHRVKMYGR
ncbi:MAG: 4-alpha-glucanotransferase [Candidatus Thiodiazotropha lotti]|uniref:4-alpha-glucanotransferase n=1 Tax=Candidatus Thiodiazotropha lotti TaxID=2792787 RepID=A0A9E4K648_9GAMM|nr:4-alpha-glucanotransferase [Candidatus Thiodiazotropha lotti]ODB92788.1 4-alpha-glucanotransferase [Candidatus Thiodiazotropha endoloripes]MCG7923687.1 4-alpha-glucanotransferase [Candidatus Thiodiazotropha lotti]MCG7929525.1 4-alpha-glucanotransferase [Candidatus Thiodiazotropha lotti]MCG7939578.1 4-alpha-glucanotransferase [Candidatus Thiodiazotropha lotti]